MDLDSRHLIEEMRLMRRHAMNVPPSMTPLDPRTHLWIIRKEALDALDRGEVTVSRAHKERHREILGIPYRVTVGDDPDTPLVQLVMEPAMFMRPVV